MNAIRELIFELLALSVLHDHLNHCSFNVRPRTVRLIRLQYRTTVGLGLYDRKGNLILFTYSITLTFIVSSRSL